MVLKQGWELTGDTPLTLWFTQFRERDTIVHIHWEDHGHGPASSQAPGGLTIPFSHVSSAVWLRAQFLVVELGTCPAGHCPWLGVSQNFFSAPSLLAKPTALQADQAHRWQPSCMAHLSEAWRMHLPSWSRHRGLWLMVSPPGPQHYMENLAFSLKQQLEGGCPTSSPPLGSSPSTRSYHDHPLS